MAKRIIVLTRDEEHGDARLRVVYWIPTVAGREAFYARTNDSEWKDATTAENDAIKAGQVIEVVESESRQPPAPPIATIQTYLEGRWATLKAQYDARNPWTRYGSFWDDTETWTPGGVS
jgi:hypothetical protein